MSKQSLMSHHVPDENHKAFISYTSGFVISILLTIEAYFIVVQHKYTHIILISSIIVLALLQFFVQIVFFMHLSKSNKPRWNVVALIFMVMIVVIFVFGSLWIMNNLNYRMMSPEQLKTYMRKEEGL